jgi:hypothetical protein
MLSFTASPAHSGKSRLAGKKLLQTLFFFLLVTQICFGQSGHMDKNSSEMVTDSTILIKRIDHIAAYYNSIAEVDSMLSLFNGALGLPQLFSPAIRDVVSPSDKFYNTAVYLGNVYLEFITFNTDTLNPPPPTYTPYFNAFAFTNEITNTAAILDSRGIPRSQVYYYMLREPDGTIINPFSSIELSNFYNNELLVFFCEYYPVAFNSQSLNWCGLPAITDPDSIHIYFGNILDSLNGGPLTVSKVKNIILTSNNFDIYRQRLSTLFFPTEEDEPGKWSPPAGPSLILQRSQTDIQLKVINIEVDSLQKAKQFLIANGLGFKEGEDYLKLDLSSNVGIDIILGDIKIVWATESYLDKAYMKINTDSILFRTRFCNLYNLEFIPHLIYINSDSTFIDSLILYDDGLHWDSLANDGLYGAYIPPQTTEDWFSLSVSTQTNETNGYFVTPLSRSFTTTGPVVINNIEYTALSNFRYTIKPYLKNNGTTAAVTNLRCNLFCEDPWVTSLLPAYRNWPGMQPGEIKTSSIGFTVSYDSAAFPGYLISE